jgi:hypothetical protein
LQRSFGAGRHKKRRVVEAVENAIETVKLTSSFKLDGLIPESLFAIYREVLVGYLIMLGQRRLRASRGLKQKSITS